ncbi:hypothetical protein [Nocardia sp. alder85J]|uniref:hypothetical protein n=1 Tax=Nocardia sp. alder85J TaxID=2862949 RepID=UPI001CD3FD53|nr:hypothetical protein [Nocardia sp. alder85J]MCX4096797.1 hypothetical protein [Nocardia sp. alder85J]
MLTPEVLDLITQQYKLTRLSDHSVTGRDSSRRKNTLCRHRSVPIGHPAPTVFGLSWNERRRRLVTATTMSR